MSPWVFVYQAPTLNEWLLESGDFFVLENGSGHWLLEA